MNRIRLANTLVTTLAIYALLLPATALRASDDDPASLASIEELLVLSKVEAMVDAIYGQFEGMMVQMEAEMGVQESEKQILDKYYQRFTELLREEVSWQRMKDPMAEIYQKHFTQKEVDDLLQFYKTDSGKAMVEKMPAVMQDSMQFSQTMMVNVMPKVQEIARELSRDLQQSRSGN